MSVPEARIFLKALNFCLSSTESQAVNQYISPELTTTKTIPRYPATVEAGAVTYDFQSVKFRYKEQEDGNCVLFVERDELLQDKEILVDGLILCRGASLGGRMFVNPLPHAPRQFPFQEKITAVKAPLVKAFIPVRKPKVLKGKTRILYVSSCTLIGGQETVLKRLLRGLDKSLYDVEVLITHERGSLHDEYASNCSKLTYVPDEVRAEERLSQWILDKVKVGKYDYIHFFNLWMAYDAIPLISKACPETRIVVSLLADMYSHRVSWKQSIDLINSVKQHLYAFVTDSQINTKLFPDITVIRNGIPVETFCPGVKDPKLFAWVGRIINEKRPDRFVELAKRLPEYKFVMGGDGFPDVIERIKESKPPNLELWFGLNERQVADLLAESTYFVFTSMTEGMPLTVLEAMASGCVVICEQVGDVSQVVTHGQTGYLVPTGNVDTAEWIFNVFKDFDLRVGEEARRVVLRDFQEENMVKQYEHLYGTIGGHRDQTRIAFVWGVLPHHGYFWESKTDSHQNAIAELSRRNVVGVFVPTGGERHNTLIHGQNYCFYHNSDPYDLVERLHNFEPDMIFLNQFWDARWPIVVKEFPEAWKALVSFGESRLKIPLANQVNLFIAQQDFRAKRIAEVNGLSSDRVTTIPFCLEQWLFKPLVREKTYEGIMVADFRKEVKRQHLLIQAWKDIPGKLVLVGPYERSLPPRYHEECMALAKSLGIEDRVIFIDGCLHAELPELINKAKVGFLTSSHEGGSRALLEMLACGIPCVVTSDCEGNVNMIRDGVEGYVAEPTPKGIAEKANKLLAANWTAMGRVASERVRRDYPYHKMSLDYKRTVEDFRSEVSIITTSFNRGKFVEDCIKSVQAQTGAKVNHIIMDAGSTDNTPQILEKYKDKVYAYVGRDSGQTDAILRGLRLIEDQFPQTRYVGWINADDYYASTWLEDSLKALIGAPPDVAMVCGDAVQVNEDGSFKQALGYVNTPYMTLEQLCKRGNIIIQPTVLIRLEALRKIREKTGRAFDPSHHYCQDLELWIRFLRNGYKIAKLGKVTANLRSHPGQMSLTHMEKQIVERDRLLRSVSEELHLPNPVWVRG